MKDINRIEIIMALIQTHYTSLNWYLNVRAGLKNWHHNLLCWLSRTADKQARRKIEWSILMMRVKSQESKLKWNEVNEVLSVYIRHNFTGNWQNKLMQKFTQMVKPGPASPSQPITVPLPMHHNNYPTQEITHLTACEVSFTQYYSPAWQNWPLMFDCLLLPSK